MRSLIVLVLVVIPISAVSALADATVVPITSGGGFFGHQFNPGSAVLFSAPGISVSGLDPGFPSPGGTVDATSVGQFAHFSGFFKQTGVSTPTISYSTDTTTCTIGRGPVECGGELFIDVTSPGVVLQNSGVDFTVALPIHFTADVFTGQFSEFVGDGTWTVAFHSICPVGFRPCFNWQQESLVLGPPIPEPSTWLLLGSGFIGLVMWRRRQRIVNVQ